MDYMVELAAIAKAHGGIIETKIAAQHGISKAMLYKLCKNNDYNAFIVVECKAEEVKIRNILIIISCGTKQLRVWWTKPLNQVTIP